MAFQRPVPWKYEQHGMTRDDQKEDDQFEE
jgi:hypothetical protein